MTHPLLLAVVPPYSTADHIQRNDPLLTARDLVFHMGRALALRHVLHAQFQATTVQDERAKNFWSRVHAAIPKGGLFQTDGPDEKTKP